MNELKDYIFSEFKKTNMGLMFDFNDKIKKVYTATFPSEKVLNELLNLNESNIMLFTHHASQWNSNLEIPFKNISVEKAKSLEERNISIYVIHVPLDNFSEYSTGTSFVKKLNFKILKPFANYRGAKAGVICKTKIKNINKLNEKVQKTVGHRSKLYKYGSSQIIDNKVAIIAGGGNDIKFLKEINELDISTFITGVTNKILTKKAHEYAKEQKINIIGATHYSTEKFACINIVQYFKELGLKSEFIKDRPVLNDL